MQRNIVQGKFLIVLSHLYEQRLLNCSHLKSEYLNIMSETPLRRSSRLARAGSQSATPAPQPSSSRGGAGGRRGRTQRASLPPVAPAASSAYGSSTRATVDRTLRPMGEASTFVASFDERRGTATTRDGLLVPTTITEEPIGTAAPPTVAPPTAGPSQQPIQHHPPGQENTSVDSSKSFGGTHEGGVAIGDRVSIRRPRTRLRCAVESVKAGFARMLQWLRVSWRTVTRSWLEICAVLCCLLMIIIAALLITIMLAAAQGRPLAVNGVVPEDAGYWKTFAASFSSQLGLSPDIEGELLSRISTVESDVGKIQQANVIREETIKKLSSELPDYVVVRKNQATGELEVSDQFWHALEARISDLRKDINSGRKDVVWDNFLKNNKARFEALISSEVSAQAGGVVDRILERYQYISREEFANLFQNNIETYLRDVDGRIKVSLDDAVRSASAIAHRVAMDHMKQIPLNQMDAVAQLNIARNIEITLKTVNHFSAYLGAVVQPYLTSPTKFRSLSFTQRFTKYAREHLAFFIKELAPAAVLFSWEEPGDCWCSAPSEKGKAQVGVLMPHRIYPSKFTVEHVPKEGTIDPASAPKWVEVWIEVEDDEQRIAVAQARNQLLDTNFAASSSSSSYVSSSSSSPSPAGDLACSTMPVGPGFVCVGKFIYNVNALNHIQTFDLDVDMQELGVAVKKAVVRVTENWGQEWTCLYRLRMHGKMAEEKYMAVE